MLLKFGIIAGLVVLGCMVFYNEISSVFPNTASVVPASLQSDVEKLGEEATVFVSDRLSESTAQLENMAGEATGSIVENIQDVQQSVVGQASELNPLNLTQ